MREAVAGVAEFDLLAPALRSASLCPSDATWNAPSRSRIESKRVRVQGGPSEGLLLEVDPRWEHTAWDGSYEPEALKVFLKLVKPHMLVFDIGAGFGFYAMLAARVGGERQYVEPDPENARSLSQHVTMNNLGGGIHIIHQAVYSHTGHITLAASEGLSAHRNTSVRVHSDDPRAGFDVPCTTLDDYIGDNTGPGIVKLEHQGSRIQCIARRRQNISNRSGSLVRDT